MSGKRAPKAVPTTRAQIERFAAVLDQAMLVCDFTGFRPDIKPTAMGRRAREATEALRQMQKEMRNWEPMHPSTPRLAPDGQRVICDLCGREWGPGEDPGCPPCARAFEAMGQ